MDDKAAHHDLETALERARLHDERGFRCLFQAFGPSVAGYLRSRQVRDPDGTANDVFVRAFRSLDRFTGDGSQFRTWLFTIAHNAAIDDARRRRRQWREQPLDLTADPRVGATNADAVSDEVMARLGGERIDALFARLSPEQRDVLYLRIVADLTVTETSAVLGKNYEAVKALQRRGLSSLRRQLSSVDGVPQ